MHVRYLQSPYNVPAAETTSNRSQLHAHNG
jgi:hypothetical protein